MEYIFNGIKLYKKVLLNAKSTENSSPKDAEVDGKGLPGTAKDAGTEKLSKLQTSKSADAKQGARHQFRQNFTFSFCLWSSLTKLKTL